MTNRARVPGSGTVLAAVNSKFGPQYVPLDPPAADAVRVGNAKPVAGVQQPPLPPYA